MEEQFKNGIATAGFVLALITIFLGWIPVFGWIIWLLGLIFSSVGLANAKKAEGKGKGLAIAGLVISLIGIAFLILLAFGLLGLGAASMF
ncbi:MAG: hypothetical protein PF485_10165 [Bacteroidales bacterium]|jgi:uncharacterized membrane protein YiaA|nr:hypothetical protein [Bacteroidales bacterium]